MNLIQIDIYENKIFEQSPKLLSMLLIDRTLSSENSQVNIFWATNNYADLGVGYQYSDQITLEAITGKNGEVIKPRAVKSREMQQQRSREMAEVFTPSWICNKQNNLIDNTWFGRDNVFNIEVDNPDGSIRGSLQIRKSYFLKVKLGMITSMRIALKLPVERLHIW